MFRLLDAPFYVQERWYISMLDFKMLMTVPFGDNLLFVSIKSKKAASIACAQLLLQGNIPLLLFLLCRTRLCILHSPGHLIQLLLIQVHPHGTGDLLQLLLIHLHIGHLILQIPYADGETADQANNQCKNWNNIWPHNALPFHS